MNDHSIEMTQAINELSGQVQIGDVVGHLQHRLARNLIDIIGDLGICGLDGENIMLPVEELFDVNKVKDRTISLVVFSQNRN